MKKSFFLFYLLLSFGFLSHAQVAYYDVVELEKYLQQSGNNFRFQGLQGDRDGFIKILKKYIEPSNRNNISTSKDLYDYFLSQGNTFLTPYLDSIGGGPNVSSALSVVTAEAIGVGPKKKNAALLALESFLIKRAKQELTVAFFDRFKEAFKEYPEFPVLFPNTYRNLGIIESFDFSVYLKTLRVGFFRDIVSLHNNLTEVEKLTPEDCKSKYSKCADRMAFYQKFFKQDGGHLLKTVSGLIEEFKTGTNAAEVITFLATDSNFEKLADSTFANLKNSVRLADLISKSLLSTDENRAWVAAKDIRKILKRPRMLSIYLGLLYQSEGARNIVFKDKANGSRSFRDLLGSFAKESKSVGDFLTRLVQDIENVNTAYAEISNMASSGQNGKSTAYLNFYTNLISFFEHASNLEDLGVELSEKNQITDFLNVARIGGSIYDGVSSENYAAAIMDTRIIIEELGLNDRAFFNEFLKYGSFMAAIAESDDQDEIEQIIESIALPPGSAAIKRRTKFNVALNAYVGLATGSEYNGATDDSKSFLGVNVPIGIATSWGHGQKYKADCDCKKERGSSSIFVSLIDLGAVTNYRFGDNDTANLPEIKLGNIFAPGAYYVYGLPKLPISLGLGGQLGPELREITNEALVLDSKVSFSFKFFLAVDIPLLNFYTKSRSN
ncbi:hypothetical protein J0X14_05950 [Muricauda sp. CAU 1633]|uniref:hypothetical protein n=1 Tax=Allomuricauda sp. CAU 1633 TaxID=2816036 RepID=UPI001A8C73CB|nr:hypothetical protein [Muricauda sp. CAU 1633]MBO0321832.1 hypothetical protein [Muricauda sp. CAU 1633]